MSTYVVNNAAYLEVSFVRVFTGQLVDPGTVTLRVTDPSNVTTDYVYLVDPSLAKSGVGGYNRSVDLDMVGVYQYRWLGTGVNKSATEWKTMTVTAA